MKTSEVVHPSCSFTVCWSMESFGATSRRSFLAPRDIVKSYVKPCATDSRIRRDVKKFVRTVSPALTLQVAKELQSFDRPVLLLWTPEDRFFPISLAERLCEDLPNARLVQIDDAYVFVAEDQPERVAREIARFVATEATHGVRVTVN